MKAEVIAMGEPQQTDIDDAAEGVSPRSMKVAAALTRKGGDEFAKPGKLIEVRFVKGQSLSLTASRLLALMILTAGGGAWRDTRHSLRKSEIRRGHKSQDRIRTEERRAGTVCCSTCRSRWSAEH